MVPLFMAPGTCSWFRPPGCVYDFRHLDAGHRFHFHGCDGFRLCFFAEKHQHFVLCFRGLSAFLVLFLLTFCAPFQSLCGLL